MILGGHVVERVRVLLANKRIFAFLLNCAGLWLEARAAFPRWIRVTRRHSQPSEEDGARARPPMLSAGLSLDTRHFHRPGGLLVLLCLRGGALYL